jgi:hypothetical protein
MINDYLNDVRLIEENWLTFSKKEMKTPEIFIIRTKTNQNSL